MENEDKSQGYPQGGCPQGYAEVVYNKVPSGPGSSFGEDSDVKVKSNDFNEQSIRKSFIWKVYSVFLCQLLVTLAFVTLFVYHIPTEIWFKTNAYMFWISLVIMLVCLITMGCCIGVRRRAPMNFIYLAIFTVAEIFLLGVSSSVFDTYAVIVMIALGITAAVSLALTLFALTKWDYTAKRGLLLCAIAVLLMFGIIAIFVRNKTISLVYAAVGAWFFSLYLIFDTHLMISNKLRYSITPEEYIFGALNLYVDGINVFIYMVTRMCYCVAKT